VVENKENESNTFIDQVTTFKESIHFLGKKRFID